MYTYVAYGVGIQSELCLPELPKSSQEVDARFQLGHVNHAPTEFAAGPHWSWADKESVVLSWDQVGKFLIHEGNRIVVDPAPAASENRLRLFLLGAALGVLLQQRGLMILHASAVELHGRAAAFLGGKGWGKSTLAATLHAQGHNLIADDVLAIDLNPERPTVLPGFPQLKVWPDVLTGIGQTAETLPRVHPALEKREYRIQKGFSERPTPLQDVYILDPGLERPIERIFHTRALLRLLPHWYCARFSSQVLRRLQAAHFLQSAALVEKVPIHLLRRTSSLSDLSDTVELVKKQHTSMP